jgi:hypothetical protein
MWGFLRWPSVQFTILNSGTVYNAFRSSPRLDSRSVFYFFGSAQRCQKAKIRLSVICPASQVSAVNGSRFRPYRLGPWHLSTKVGARHARAGARREKHETYDGRTSFFFARLPATIVPSLDARPCQPCTGWSYRASLNSKTVSKACHEDSEWQFASCRAKEDLQSLAFPETQESCRDGRRTGRAPTCAGRYCVSE